jgi:phosphoribosylformylglycinamidine cyclo-ligase
VFDVVASAGGRVERAELERTFNMGVGMVAVLPAASVDTALATLREREVPAWVLGEVAERPAGTPAVTLENDYGNGGA